MKLEKVAEILAQLTGSNAINQPQLVTNISIRKGLGKAGLRRKVSGTHPLLN